MKKKKILKIVLLSIAIVLLLVILAAAALVISFIHKYNSTSYESVEIVSRTDTYLPPDPPDIIIDSDGDPDTTESVAQSDTEAVTSVATEGGEGTPPETLPNDIYTPPANNDSSSSSPGVTYNSNNSFGNSNAVSVYGGTPIYKVNQKDPNVENILIVGTDARDVTVHRGLSDVMIVVSYNKAEGTIKLLSFLRDSLVPIEGYGWGKLNWTYIRYGIGSTINTINQCFDLDIQRFIVIDFNGTQNFINYIGGIDLYLSAAEASHLGIGDTDGTYHLDGGRALKHCRNRKLDSDFGRTRRQRDVVSAVINKMKSGIELSEVLGILDNALKMVKTNIPFTTMVSLVTSAVTGGSLSMESHSVPFIDAYYYGWINGTDSVVCFDFNATKQRIHDILY